MSAERWERLQADLLLAGIEYRLDERRYDEIRYGQRERGVTRKILVRAGDRIVEVCDRYGRGGKWYGWQVWVEGKDALVKATWTTTRNRHQVVADVLEAMRAPEPPVTAEQAEHAAEHWSNQTDPGAPAWGVRAGPTDLHTRGGAR